MEAAERPPDRTGETAPQAGGAFFGDAVHCGACRYAMRGLPLGSRCPECGGPGVDLETVEPLVSDASLRGWLMVGAVLAAVGLAGSLAAALSLGAPLRSLNGATAGLTLLVAAAALMLATPGVWVCTLRVLDRRTEDDHVRHRAVSRAATLIGLALLVFAASLHPVLERSRLFVLTVAQLTMFIGLGSLATLVAMQARRLRAWAAVGRFQRAGWFLQCAWCVQVITLPVLFLCKTTIHSAQDVVVRTLLGAAGAITLVLTLAAAIVGWFCVAALAVTLLTWAGVLRAKRVGGVARCP